MPINELLLKRFATKKFDPSRRVSDADLAYVLEACRLSPSSANTQPWRIAVVTDPELRARISEAAYRQSQVTDAGILLVVSALRHPGPRILKNAEIIASQSGQASAAAYEKMATGWIPPTPKATLAWCQKQTYLALQAMMLAAAERGLDSCPMEGFDPAKVTALLGYEDAVATTMLALGYAAAPGRPKVRVPLEDIVDRRP